MIKIICVILLLAQFSNCISISDVEIDESFKKLLHDIDLLIDESYKLWDKISVQSKEIEDYREQELQRLKDKSIYKNSVEDLKSSTLIECIKKYKSDIEDLISKTKESIDECSKGISKDITILLEEIISTKHIILQEKEKLVSLAEECIKENPANPMGIFKCIKNKGEYIKNDLKQLIKKLEFLLDDAKHRIEENVNETKNCIDNQIKEAISVMKKYVSELKECIKTT